MFELQRASSLLKVAKGLVCVQVTTERERVFKTCMCSWLQVDLDVTLRNCVPEDVVVWGDSGRIVQVI
jgi:hypothetical protein